MTRTTATAVRPLLALAAAALAGCTARPAETAAGGDSAAEAARSEDVATSGGTGTGEVATLGAGCFWCVEAVLEQVDGVLDVASGYMGGEVEHPTYEAVCTGRTGHAEVVQVRFDPERIGYEELLDWFWRLHDPTTVDRQGNDVGPQYRSVIFAHSGEQRRIAERSKEAAQEAFDRPIVTEIAEAGAFWPAEEYHQDYYRENPRAGYCQVVIAPKLRKLGLRD